ncbi:MAG: hypothetical protein M0C28_33800 [Candidatus Moduliflexus flocculans]|nr:hypothetical protein [Candidatus Moduliflexus flocculans]
MTALKAAFRTTWLGGFAAALILLGLAYEVFFRYGYVTDYPLSLGWSEEAATTTPRCGSRSRSTGRPSPCPRFIPPATCSNRSRSFSPASTFSPTASGSFSSGSA